MNDFNFYFTQVLILLFLFKKCLRITLIPSIGIIFLSQCYTDGWFMIRRHFDLYSRNDYFVIKIRRIRVSPRWDFLPLFIKYLQNLYIKFFYMSSHLIYFSIIKGPALFSGRAFYKN